MPVIPRCGMALELYFQSTSTSLDVPPIRSPFWTDSSDCSGGSRMGREPIRQRALPDLFVGFGGLGREESPMLDRTGYTDLGCCP